MIIHDCHIVMLSLQPSICLPETLLSKIQEASQLSSRYSSLSHCVDLEPMHSLVEKATCPAPGRVPRHWNWMDLVYSYLSSK